MEGMVTWPKADEIPSYACEANGQQKEDAQELHLLDERIREPSGRDSQPRGPPSQMRCHEQAENACQENELSRIRGENGSEEFDKALQQ